MVIEVARFRIERATNVDLDVTAPQLLRIPRTDDCCVGVEATQYCQRERFVRMKPPVVSSNGQNNAIVSVHFLSPALLVKRGEFTVLNVTNQWRLNQENMAVLDDVGTFYQNNLAYK